MRTRLKWRRIPSNLLYRLQHSTYWASMNIRCALLSYRNMRFIFGFFSKFATFFLSLSLSLSLSLCMLFLYFVPSKWALFILADMWNCKLKGTKFDVCVTLHHWYNNINSLLVATIIILFCLQAASSVLYTISCKHNLVLLRMGEIIAWNMLSWLKLLIKLLLLHLIGCLYYCIKGTNPFSANCAGLL